MAETPEELALELSRAALDSRDQSEGQLREKSTAVLSAASIVVPVAAASIVVPVAAVAIGNGPADAAIPFGVAALAYFFCARACGAALFPKNRQAGLLGSELLKLATENKAELRQMQASAAGYLDYNYVHNQAILESAAERVGEAIVFLGAEILALVAALIVTLVQ